MCSYPASPIQTITEKGEIMRQKGRGLWERGEELVIRDHACKLHPGASFLFLEEVLENNVRRYGSIFTGDRWERYQIECDKNDRSFFTYNLSY